MRTERTIQLTAGGHARLVQELKHLTEVKLPDISARIQDATEHGDVSDNSEYEDLKEEFVLTEARIRELEQTLERAEIIQEGSVDGTIHPGSHVTVRSDDGEEETWVLVSPEEASAVDGRISTESPVGKALVGSRVGDSATVTTPGGKIVYTVIGVR